MSNQLPPRERGLQPTHFIEAYSNGKFFTAQQVDYCAKNGAVCDIQELGICITATAVMYRTLHTVAIFKIYPK